MLFLIFENKNIKTQLKRLKTYLRLIYNLNTHFVKKLIYVFKYVFGMNFNHNINYIKKVLYLKKKKGENVDRN